MKCSVFFNDYECVNTLIVLHNLSFKWVLSDDNDVFEKKPITVPVFNTLNYYNEMSNFSQLLFLIYLISLIVLGLIYDFIFSTTDRLEKKENRLVNFSFASNPFCFLV